MKLIFLLLFSHSLLCQVRITYIIKNNNSDIIAERITLAEYIGSAYRTVDIYKLKDGEIYLEKYSFYDEKIMKAIEKSKRRAIGIGKIKDCGLEIETKYRIRVNDNYYEFSLLGDITYEYTKDENGNILKDEDAYRYIINKNEYIKKFFEIMAYESKHCLQGPRYIFLKKKVAKKLGLLDKKFKIKLEDLPCTETEKELGYDCAKYISFSKLKIKKPPCRRL